MVTERDVKELYEALDRLKDGVAKKADVQEIHRAIDTLRIRITDFEQKLKAPEPAQVAPSPREPSAQRSRGAPRPTSE